MSEPSPPPNPTGQRPLKAGRRAAPRVRLHVPAKVILLHGLEKCQLDNLSQHGARITLSSNAPRLGSGAVLQVNDLDVFGTVVWSGGQRFGLQFEEAVPLPQVVGIRHYADSYAENEAMVNRRNARNFVHGRPHLRPSR